VGPRRDNIELLIAWLDALRRGDLPALRAGLREDAFWQGLRPEWRCNSGGEIAEHFAARRAHYGEIGVLELIGAEGHAILHAHGGDLRSVEDVPLPDGIYNVFAIEAGQITRIGDFAERAAALAAAGLPG
jgi:ketosteroid isomerase-like protein